MGNYFNRLCGGKYSHDELSALYMEDFKESSQKWQKIPNIDQYLEQNDNEGIQYCQGWVYILKYDKVYIEQLESFDKIEQQLNQLQNLANLRSKTQNIFSQSILLSQEQEFSPINQNIESQISDQQSQIIEEAKKIDILGDKYYCILQSDCLKLFESKQNAYKHMKDQTNQWENRPDCIYTIYRHSKSGLIESNPNNFSFKMFFQDNQFKMKKIKIQITLDIESFLEEIIKYFPQMAEQKMSQEHLKRRIFENWKNQLKITQRPVWVDPDVMKCYICEENFSIINRQHHCRKCGTAICSNCSNNKIKLPELAYYQPERVCRNCFESITCQQNNTQIKRYQTSSFNCNQTQNKRIEKLKSSMIFERKQLGRSFSSNNDLQKKNN